MHEKLNQQNTQLALLYLIIPPKLEEMMVDELLLQTAISGFTSSKVSGHGTYHGNDESLSMVEQVTGRQQRVQFMIHGELKDLRNITETLKSKFRATDIHSILVPTF